MENKKDLYLVWQSGDDEQYYNQYFSLKDAVTSENEGAEILKATLKSVGRFKVVAKLIRQKVKKSIKKAAKGKK